MVFDIHGCTSVHMYLVNIDGLAVGDLGYSWKVPSDSLLT